jgi:hypothetical protein
MTANHFPISIRNPVIAIDSQANGKANGYKAVTAFSNQLLITANNFADFANK